MSGQIGMDFFTDDGNAERLAQLAADPASISQWPPALLQQHALLANALVACPDCLLHIPVVYLNFALISELKRCPGSRDIATLIDRSLKANASKPKPRLKIAPMVTPSETSED
jgi:hypothetical protein